MFNIKSIFLPPYYWSSCFFFFFFFLSNPFAKGLEVPVILTSIPSFQGLLSFYSQGCSGQSSTSFTEGNMLFIFQGEILLCIVQLYFFILKENKNPICVNYRVWFKFLKTTGDT
jgi:hypothetical protein